MKIRKEQMAALERAALKGFEVDMVRHLAQYAPRLSQVAGEDAVRREIRFGLERAGRYGFTKRGPVRFYIELMVRLGCDFDTDPLLPWANAALKEAPDQDQMVRADRLFERAMDYFHKVFGPDDEQMVAALRRIDEARLEDYPASAHDLEEVGLRGLTAMYPQKCEYVGEPALRALIRRGPELARKYSTATDLGLALFIALPFALGHGFAADPLYPWIAGVLGNAMIADPEKRVERLYNRTKTYLGEALARLERR